MEGHVVSLEPSVRGALWRLSCSFPGRPFCIERMVLARTADPWARSLTFEGRAGLGDQKIFFRAPFTILTSIAPRTEEWSASEQAAFLGLSSVLTRPFTVHAMVAELPRVEKPTRYGETLVARTVWRVVRFQGDCGRGQANRHFQVSVPVWETQEIVSNGIVPWGWDFWFPEISLE